MTDLYGADDRSGSSDMHQQLSLNEHWGTENALQGMQHYNVVQLTWLLVAACQAYHCLQVGRASTEHDCSHWFMSVTAQIHKCAQQAGV